MTKEEVYDLACKIYTSPAVMRLGDECILGYWVDVPKDENHTFILKTRSGLKGVVVVEAAASWKALAAKADLLNATEKSNGKR